MKLLHVLLVPVVAAVFPFSALADSWKDESGHGHGRHEFKEEYWDGNCKVKRKLQKHGEYKEERKCKGPSRVYYEQPVYVPAAPPAVVEPGITIHGTVRIP